MISAKSCTPGPELPSNNKISFQGIKLTRSDTENCHVSKILVTAYIQLKCLFFCVIGHYRVQPYLTEPVMCMYLKLLETSVVLGKMHG